jgi:rfaE bifunctional protein nucleotidyltransferase chain/domain
MQYMKHTSDKIMDWPQAKAWRERMRHEGRKVVFTNGCFDILHLGHVDYLEKAAQLGDALIVALNTDASVQQLKGPSRPINAEYARARVMASLGFVDAVLFFGEETPLDIIALLVPDVLVKGGDYTPENIVGAPLVKEAGGLVATIPLVEGFSTTNIIKKSKA